MTDELDLTARITEPSPPSDPMYTVQHAADQAAIAILLAVADVARGPVSVDDLSRLAACCRSMVAPVVAIDQPKDDARAILADVDEDIVAAYLGATGERLHGLDDDSRTTTIQELGMLASSAAKLRAELDAANAEVAKLRAELAEAKRIGEQPANVLAGVRSVLHAYGRADVLMTENAVRSVLRDLELARSQAAELDGTTQEVVNANKLISDVFALLAKDGFRSDNLPRLVETVLESLRQAQSERDATDAALDIANRNHGAQLSSTQHALRLANTQLEVANANLLAALRLQQDAPNAKMLVGGLVDLVTYWRKGGSPYDDAATAVEKLLGETFADTLDQVRRERAETNEYAPPVGPEHNDVHGLRCDIRRDQWDGLRSLMINSSFLACPRCFIVIKSRNNERGKRGLILVWRGRLKDCPGFEFEYHYDGRILRRSHGASDWETAPVEDRWALSKYLTPLLSIARREDIVTNEIGAIVSAARGE